MGLTLYAYWAALVQAILAFPSSLDLGTSCCRNTFGQQFLVLFFYLMSKF